MLSQNSIFLLARTSTFIITLRMTSYLKSPLFSPPFPIFILFHLDRVQDSDLYPFPASFQFPLSLKLFHPPPPLLFLSNQYGTLVPSKVQSFLWTLACGLPSPRIDSNWFTLSPV